MWAILRLPWMSYCENMHKCKEINRVHKEYTRKFVSEFYKYIIINIDVPTDEIIELKKYKELLDVKERIKSERAEVKWSSFVHNEVATNFPLKSRIEELYLYSYAAPNSVKATVQINYVRYGNGLKPFFLAVSIML